MIIAIKLDSPRSFPSKSIPIQLVSRGSITLLASLRASPSRVLRKDSGSSPPFGYEPSTRTNGAISARWASASLALPSESPAKKSQRAANQRSCRQGDPKPSWRRASSSCIYIIALGGIWDASWMRPRAIDRLIDWSIDRP